MGGYVLAIDTSSAAVVVGVVAVADVRGEHSTPDVRGEHSTPDARDEHGERAAQDGLTVIAGRAPVSARGHTELLTPAIADCLREAALDPVGLAGVVVGTGPGPYTGLRVGVVSAAALAQGAGRRPVHGVCSLDAIGHACRDEPALLVATDARRREVFWARYEYGRRVGELHVDRPDGVATDGLSAVAGTGTQLYPDAWPGLRRRDERHPDPVSLVALARPRLDALEPGDPLEPIYLRRPDAVEPGRPKTVTR